MGRRAWLRQLTDMDLVTQMANAFVDSHLAPTELECERRGRQFGRLVEEYRRRHRHADDRSCTCWDCCRRFKEVPLTEQLQDGPGQAPG